MSHQFLSLDLFIRNYYSRLLRDLDRVREVDRLLKESLQLFFPRVMANVRRIRRDLTAPTATRIRLVRFRVYSRPDEKSTPATDR
mgnify:CR=1 FL=1